MRRGLHFITSFSCTGRSVFFLKAYFNVKDEKPLHFWKKGNAFFTSFCAAQQIDDRCQCAQFELTFRQQSVFSLDRFCCLDQSGIIPQTFCCCSAHLLSQEAFRKHLLLHNVNFITIGQDWTTGLRGWGVTDQQTCYKGVREEKTKQDTTGWKARLNMASMRLDWF